MIPILDIGRATPGQIWGRPMPATDHSPLQQDIRALYCDHHSWLQGWLRRKLGNAGDAADLAHDTFLRLLGKSGAPDVRAPRAYLSTIARGLVADFFRRRDIEHNYLAALAALPEQHTPSPEERALILETLHAIDALLDGMKPAVRRAFLLSQLEGLTYPEIAGRLGVTVRTVNNYMASAFEHCYLAAP
jgi:RNA polymerase sigma-70 factor (ECF subfamily)